MRIAVAKQPCPHCGKGFKPSRSNQVYCSQSCRRLHKWCAKNSRYGESGFVPGTIVETCQHCHESFKLMKPLEKFCSDDCYTVYWREYRQRYWQEHKDRLTDYHKKYHEAHLAERRKQRLDRYYERKKEKGASG
jgi:hypothetical protein